MLERSLPVSYFAFNADFFDILRLASGSQKRQDIVLVVSFFQSSSS